MKTEYSTSYTLSLTEIRQHESEFNLEWKNYQCHSWSTVDHGDETVKPMCWGDGSMV